MPIYTSVLKLDKPIGTPPHPVEVSVYSSPYGGYIRVSEMDVHNENAAAFTSALMSADECRALARSLGKVRISHMAREHLLVTH